MKTVAALLLSALLAACASVPPMPPAAELFRDELFAPPSVAIDPNAAMAVSDAMRRYVVAKRLNATRADDRKKLLIDALYRKDELKLEYDAEVTRTAAQAFDARSGNCLALLLMTAAFAKELGLAVRYQAAVGDDVWDRSGELYVAVGHVNLTLADGPPRGGFGITESDSLTVDFIAPPAGRAPPRMRTLDERTVIAMFLNNRAVESLERGATDDAYWWAREALRHDPALTSAYLTLGVIYRNRHAPALADAALRRVVEREPDNTKALANRVLVLRDLGRDAEALALQQRLDRLDPHPPYSYFNAGMAALRAHRLDDARSLFAKEVERAPYQSEFQFWLAMTYLELHDAKRATAHLTRAMEVSTTRKDHDLYAAKLGRLKALAPQ